MTALFHAMNIGTLAAWLTVAGASTVACTVKVVARLPELLSPGADDTEVVITPMDMGSAAPAANPDADAPDDATVAAAEPVSTEIPQMPELPELPEMPDLPETADLAPLPDVPDLPPPPTRTRESSDAPKVVARQASRPKATTGRTTAARTGTGGTGNKTASGWGTGSGNGTAAGSGSGATGSSRWVGLRKSSPAYPTAAKRAGQQGRVVVQFTVDERGYVVDAKVVGPCAYPSLNEEALRTVRRFKARPGSRATTTQPIIFQLR